MTKEGILILLQEPLREEIWEEIISVATNKAEEEIKTVAVPIIAVPGGKNGSIQ